MSKTYAILIVLASVLLGFGGPLPASSETLFTALLEPYERIRLDLVQDRGENVQAQARRLQQVAREMASVEEPERLAVGASRVPEVQRLVPELEAAAAKLVAAETMEQRRLALAELTRPLVRYRGLVEGERPLVAYCSMAKRAWLQPAGEIGNPYMGQRMPGCGEVVAD